MDCNNIQSVIIGNHCTGCCVCASACPVRAIEIAKDEYGFVIPRIDRKRCIQCGNCKTVCPALVVESDMPKDCYAGLNKSRDLLLKSSSGGIFSAISEKILSEGGVVYGATMTADFKVNHIRVDDKKELSKILGSKYVQSCMGNTYINICEDLQAGKTVLFSGTPCMVSAVKNYCRNEISGKLILVDIVCHGVPSQDFFDSYLLYLNEKIGGIEHYKFRAKRCEHNGMNWFFSLRKKGEKRERIFNWLEDPYNYMYMLSDIYRESCYSCKYACPERVGDITLCDFWGWEKYYSEFPLGSTVSGILINTSAGQKIFEEIKAGFNFATADYEAIKENNGCLVKPSSRPEVRDHIFNEWKKDGFSSIAAKYGAKTRGKILKAKLVRLLPAFIVEIHDKIRAKG